MKTVLAAALFTLASGSVMADNFRDNGVWDRHLSVSDNDSNVQINMKYDLAAYEESAFDVGQFGRVNPTESDQSIGSGDMAYQESVFDIPS